MSLESEYSSARPFSPNIAQEITNKVVGRACLSIILAHSNLKSLPHQTTLLGDQTDSAFVCKFTFIRTHLTRPKLAARDTRTGHYSYPIHHKCLQQSNGY